MTHLFEEIEAARQAITAHSTLQPATALILGSGLGELANAIENATVIPYSAIPHFPTSTVHGHRGELVLGLLAGHPVVVMRGRFHFYEGYTPAQTTFPVRVMRALGAGTLIVTNAAGGLRADWQVGDLMLITDHINVPGMAGYHPLRGANDERLGPRFPAMTNAYDVALGARLRALAPGVGITLREGVYTQLAGPSFETRAELRLLQRWGSDAVGMSTASEVTVAAHAGMRVLGISLISNIATPDAPPANHAEVLAAGEAVKERFGQLLLKLLAEMESSPS